MPVPLVWNFHRYQRKKKYVFEYTIFEFTWIDGNQIVLGTKNVRGACSGRKVNRGMLFLPFIVIYFYEYNFAKSTLQDPFIQIASIENQWIIFEREKKHSNVIREQQY